MRNGRPWVAAGALLLFAGAAPAKEATTYGEVTVAVESEPQNQNNHGYSEYLFSITNKSTARKHTVTLWMPREDFGGRGDYVRSITRTVDVEPDSVTFVPLLVPFFPPVIGGDLRVYVDGDKQDAPVRLHTVPSRPFGGGGPWRSGRGYGIPASGSGMAQPLVLVSQAAIGDKDFAFHLQNLQRVVPTWPGAPLGGIPGGAATIPGMGGSGMGGPGGVMVAPDPFGGPPGAPPAGAPPATGPPAGPRPGVKGGGKPPAPVSIKVANPVQVCRSDVPLRLWLDTWLGYSRYDGVIVTGEELATAPPAVQTALWQYAETGGSLLVLGAANVPESWKKRPTDKTGLKVHSAGFGAILTCEDRDYARWPDERWSALADVWAEAASNPWFNQTNATEANRLLRVVEDVGIPVRGLFVLMLLFTVAIGPVNLWLLGRKGRRLWMLWTVPAISLATCLAVFGVMLVVEGWQGHLRTEGVTILDERSQRATSLGWTGFYAPMAPSSGLHFHRDTEAVWQKVEDNYRSDGASCTLDWSRDQHFASGWISARVPSHFKLRKSEPRKERLSVSRRPDGSLVVVNDFGADIKELWLADARGRVYTAEEVAVGSAPVTLTLRADLPAVKESTRKAGSEGAETNPFHNLLQGSSWLSQPPPVTREVRPAPLTRGGKVAVKTGGAPPAQADPAAPGGAPGFSVTRYLVPGGYVAVLDGTPFFEDALLNAKTHKGKSVVIGIMKDLDEAH
jgi:hypothetical protein